VITTEKDAVRVGQQAWWAALPMQVAIEPADEFATWLRGRLPPSSRRSTASIPRHAEAGSGEASR
jgi:hypothetical protein